MPGKRAPISREALERRRCRPSGRRSRASPRSRSRPRACGSCRRGRAGSSAARARRSPAPGRRASTTTSRARSRRASRSRKKRSRPSPATTGAPTSASGGEVEVVVVAVRDEHGVDGRQVRDRARPAARSGSMPPKMRRLQRGVDEERDAVELHEEGGVAEPGDPRGLARRGRRARAARGPARPRGRARGRARRAACRSGGPRPTSAGPPRSPSGDEPSRFTKRPSASRGWVKAVSVMAAAPARRGRGAALGAGGTLHRNRRRAGRHALTARAGAFVMS